MSGKPRGKLLSQTRQRPSWSDWKPTDNKAEVTSFFFRFAFYSLNWKGGLTVCVTCVWAGVDSAWEQEKPEASLSWTDSPGKNARKCRTPYGQSHPSAALRQGRGAHSQPNDARCLVSSGGSGNCVIRTLC